MYHGVSSCPVLSRNYVHESKHGEMSYNFSQTRNAGNEINEAIQKGTFKGKRLIFVGDSLTRQNFQSLACITYVNGLWDIYTSAFGFASGPNTYFNDARIQLHGDLGELFSSPIAGNVLRFGWKTDFPAYPLHGNEHWLESCRERRPFVLDTYRLPSTGNSSIANAVRTFSASDPYLEKVTLNKGDIVFINIGHHPATRSSNIERLTEFLDCVELAQKEDNRTLEDLDWPRLYYMTSTVSFFPTGYETVQTNGCEDINKNSQYHNDETEAFDGRVPFIDRSLDLTKLGHLKVGGTDCIHWTMPGVPDVINQEIVKSLASTMND